MKNTVKAMGLRAQLESFSKLQEHLHPAADKLIKSAVELIDLFFADQQWDKTEHSFREEANMEDILTKSQKLMDFVLEAVEIKEEEKAKK